MDAIAIILSLVLIWVLARLVRFLSIHYRMLPITGVHHLDNHFLLGNLPSITDRPNVFYNIVPNLTEQEHRLRKFSSGPFRLPLAVVSHPDTVAELLKASPPKNMILYSLLLPFIGDGLLVSSGKKWARDRRLLTNAFHFNILRDYTPLLHDSCQVFVEKLAEHAGNAETQNKAFDFSKACCLLTLDVMLRCTMGHESNCQLEDSEYTKGVLEATQLLFKRGASVQMFLPDFIYSLTEDCRKFRDICSMCHKFTAGIIRKRKTELEDSGQLASAENGHDSHKTIREGRTSFLDILLTVKDEDGTGLSNDEIRDQVDTFLFEGHDTTSSAMQWLFYFLAKHPVIQEECRREADQFCQADGFVTHDDLCRLTFITQCIKESLRMSCPVVFFERALTEDTLIDGYVVPKSVAVNIDIFALHHNPSVYPDPYTFDPSRFSEESCRGRHPHAFIPFSAGSRNCIGQVLAMNELRLALASVLVRFHLSVDPGLPEPLFDDSIVMRARHGIQLLVSCH